MHSKLARKISGAVFAIGPENPIEIEKVVDDALENIRKTFEPEELSRCPIVTHHPAGPCAFCITAAMREFILLQE